MFWTHDCELQLRMPPAHDAEGVEHQPAALFHEEVLGNEQKRTVGVIFRAEIGLYETHAGPDDADALGGQAVVSDQIIARIGAEGENMLGLRERRAFERFEGSCALCGIARRVGAMAKGLMPSLIAVDPMPQPCG